MKVIAEASIRLRILKGSPPGERQCDIYRHCRGFDPAEDTESACTGPAVPFCSFIAEASIRLRILKVSTSLVGQADVKDCRGFDPPEDTERLFKLVGEATQEKNCRGFDPPEDTESLHFCQYRWSVIWHCRGFDPPEDTERTSQSATIAATGLIAEASIRLRILKAGTNQNKPGVAIEI